MGKESKNVNDHPVCFKCNILNPYCQCDVYFPKTTSTLRKIKYIVLTTILLIGALLILEYLL